MVSLFSLKNTRIIISRNFAVLFLYASETLHNIFSIVLIESMPILISTSELHKALIFPTLVVGFSFTSVFVLFFDPCKQSSQKRELKYTQLHENRCGVLMCCKIFASKFTPLLLWRLETCTNVSITVSNFRKPLNFKVFCSFLHKLKYVFEVRVKKA